MKNRLFLIFYAIAFLSLTLFPHIILQPGGIGSNPLTLGQVSLGFLFFGGIWFVYKNRHLPGFDVLWKYLFVFLVVVFGTLAWGYLKEKYRDSKK